MAGDEVFRDLVIARIVEPTSLLDIDRALAEMGRVSASLSTRKRTRRRWCQGGYRDQIATACFNHALAVDAGWRRRVKMACSPGQAVGHVDRSLEAGPRALTIAVSH